MHGMHGGADGCMDLNPQWAQSNQQKAQNIRHRSSLYFFHYNPSGSSSSQVILANVLRIFRK